MFRKKINTLNKRAKIFSALFISIFIVGGAVGMVRADQFDEQIKALQQQNAASQAASNDLASQASSYQDAIDKLEQQIDSLQQSIVDNQLKEQELQRQIDQAQIELNHQKEVLGENIKSMYIDGQVTTLEILANSSNLSDFVNQQEYQSTVQNKVKATLDKINQLKAQLTEQQKELQIAIADLKKQQSDLSATQAQQNSMLAYTESQKQAFDASISANKSKIADLRRQQAAENARLLSANGSYVVAGNNGNDTYPNKWRSAYQDSIIDNWGMFNRECVSYTAWKVYESGRYMPYWGGVGNANQWDDDAIAAGIPVDSSPRVGDVAIKNSYPYGHAMYVEKVYGDGSIYVSQYNAALNGTYSEAYISGAAVSANGLLFIHF